MLLADYCIEFKDSHFQTRTEKGIPPLLFEFYLNFFHSLYELNLGNDKESRRL